MQAEPVYQCYEAVKKKIETKALLSNPGTRKKPACDLSVSTGKDI